MNRIAIFLSPFLIVMLLLQVGFTQVQDDKATQILKESKEAFDGLSDFTAAFKYGLSSSRPEKKTSSIEKEGSISFKKGMFHIDMDDQEVYCDGETQWIYLKDDNEVNISDYDPEEGVNIESIFELYETSAHARYDGEETLKGIKYHKIFLASSDGSLDYNQIKLWINKKSSFLEKAVLIDRRQTITTIEFWNIITNKDLETADFKFNATNYPEVDEYDER